MHTACLAPTLHFLDFATVAAILSLCRSRQSVGWRLTESSARRVTPRNEKARIPVRRGEADRITGRGRPQRPTQATQPGGHIVRNRSFGRTAAAVLARSRTRRRGWAVVVVAALLAAGFGAGQRARAEDEPEMAEKKPVKGIPGIFAMDPDGSNPRPLVKLPGMRWHGSPTWSHDGKMVAFDATSGAFSASHVYVYVVKGPFKGMLRNMGTGLFPAFSPDDSTIAFGGPGDPARGQAGVPGVWLMNADGTNRRWLCDGDHPKWSPDGKRLAVTHEDQEPGTIDIVTVSTGQATRVLT